MAILALSLLTGMITPPTGALAAVLDLPEPGTLVSLSEPYAPARLMGINVYPDRPLTFDFIMDQGDGPLAGEDLQQESDRLIKYFLAALTVPETEMWVNLSPYEENRIIPAGFGETQMGRDLLALDYMLKQLSSSLMHPDERLGSAFWQRVYQRAQQRFGSTDIPINTFNKIWIVPERATVYEHPGGAFIVDSHLKVMLEEDYLALEANQGSTQHGLGEMTVDDVEVISGVSGEIVREILIPEIEAEVNSGRTFAKLRQIYHSMLLAAWYKNRLRESLLGQVYVDKTRTDGIAIADREINHKIYEQYVDSFQKGVFNLVKEETDPSTHEPIPRKYFSGGVELNGDQATVSATDAARDAELNQRVREAARRLTSGLQLTVGLDETGPQRSDRAMLSHSKAQVLGIAQRVAREETDENSPAFQKWYSEVLAGFRLRNNIIYGITDGLEAYRLEAYLQSNRNDALQIYTARNLLRQSAQEGRPVLLEIGAGNTEVAVQIARQNPGMNVIATDIWQTDPTDSLKEYVADAVAFEEGTLPAQTEGLPNLAAVRAQADLIGHLPDGSLDYILLVNPSRGAIYELIVMVREFNLADKLRPGGQIILKTADSVEPFFDLLDGRFQFGSLEGYERFGVDLQTAAAWQEDFLKGKLYAGTRVADALADIFDPTVPQAAGADKAVLAMVTDMAQRYGMDEAVIQGIVANNLNVETFAGGLLSAIRRQNPQTRFTQEAVVQFLRRRGYFVAGILDERVLTESLVLFEEPENPEDDPTIYTIEGDEYRRILQSSLEAGPMARQMARMREVSRRLTALRTGRGLYFSDAGARAQEYFDQMEETEQAEVSGLMQTEGMSQGEAVAVVLGRKFLDERQRVAVRSMDHSASAAVDPFEKLSRLQGWFDAAASVGAFDAAVRSEFLILQRNLYELNIALRSFAANEPAQPNFKFTRIYDFENRWLKLERAINDFAGLIRDVAEQSALGDDEGQQTLQRIIDATAGISRDLTGQMAFAFGDAGYNRQTIDLVDTVRQRVAELAERRGFKEDYVSVEATAAAERVTINVNPTWLSLIISNLVNNAHDEIYKQIVTGARQDYAEGDIRVILDYDEARGEAIVRVHDKAGGIDPTASLLEQRFGRERIFEYGGTAGKSGGTGVGLAEVYHITQIMNWSLALNPRVEVDGSGVFGAEFTVAIPDTNVSADRAVLANVRTVARQYEMDEGVVQGILASNIRLDAFVRGLLTTVRRQDPQTELDVAAIESQLTEQGLIRDGLLIAAVLDGSLVLSEPSSGRPYAVSDAQLDNVVFDSIAMEPFALQLMRFRPLALNRDRQSVVAEGDLEDIRAGLEKYISELNLDERSRVEDLTVEEGLGRVEAVAWVLGEKLIAERRRVAVRSMEHSASAAVDPFEKLASLSGIFSLAAITGGFDQRQQEEFRAMVNTLTQFQNQMQTYAQRDANTPDFDYGRMYDFEKRWQRLVRTIGNYIGLFRGQALRVTPDQTTHTFLADQAARLVHGISRDIESQIAFAQGNLAYNRQTVNIIEGVTATVDDLTRRRGYVPGYVTIEAGPGAAEAQIDINPTWLSLIISNLVNNAHDEIKKQVAAGERDDFHAGDIRIRLDYDEGNGTLELSVHDTAGGINPESSLLDRRLGRARLFEFGRTAGKETGTGVGLAEVYHITRLLRWDLELAPQAVVPGTDASGARFAMTIPYNRKSDQAALAARPEEVGGIDMNPALAAIRLTGQPGVVPVSTGILPAANLEVNGFVPVILHTAPVHNVPLLLGLE